MKNPNYSDEEFRIWVEFSGSTKRILEEIVRLREELQNAKCEIENLEYWCERYY